MGKRRGPKQKPWEQLFWIRVDPKDGHWYWKGRYTNNPYKKPSKNAKGQPVFSSSSCPDTKGNASAMVFAYLFFYKKMPEYKLYSNPSCSKEDGTVCVYPPHLFNSIDPVAAGRDQDIVAKYKNYVKWSKYNMAAIGREHGITRERVRQILALHGITGGRK